MFLKKIFLLTLAASVQVCVAQLENFPYAEFSPNGKLILTCDYSTLTYRLLEVPSGQLSTEIATGFSKVNPNNFVGGRLPDFHLARFSNDGNYVYLRFNSSIVIWDVRAKRITTKLDNSIYQNFTFHRFAQEGSKVNYPDEFIDKLLKKHKRVGVYPVFSRDGKYMAVHSMDYKDRNTIKLIDLASGKLTQTFSGVEFTTSVGFSPDSKLFFGKSFIQDKNTLMIWETSSANVVDSLSGCFSPKLSKNGNVMVTLMSDPNDLSDESGNTAKVWDVETRKLLLTLSGHTKKLTNVEFSYDGKIIGTSSFDGTIKLWNSETGEQLKDITGISETTLLFGFDLTGKYLIAGDETQVVYLLEVETGKLIGRL